jgi:hypothetical protein
VRVSINGGSLGPLTDLERVRTANIKEIRYLTATDAAQRFGTSSQAGPVILVVPK